HQSLLDQQPAVRCSLQRRCRSRDLTVSRLENGCEQRGIVSSARKYAYRRLAPSFRKPYAASTQQGASGGHLPIRPERAFPSRPLRHAIDRIEGQTFAPGWGTLIKELQPRVRIRSKLRILLKFSCEFCGPRRIPGEHFARALLCNIRLHVLLGFKRSVEETPS